MELLEGVKRERIREGRRREEEKEEEGDDIQGKEIWEVVKKMKNRKAVGVDELPMEVWKYVGKDLGMSLVKLLKQIWRENELPEDWRRSIIVPIYKRGNPNMTGNYRGISLLCTNYKIYAEIMKRRLERVMENNGVLPETQAGFRRGRSALNNIFILSHLAQRGDETERKEKREEKKTYAFFADLKAAFDNVDRELLWRIIREQGIEEKMVKRMERIYEKTEVVVRTNEGLLEGFETRKGVRGVL